MDRPTLESLQQQLDRQAREIAELRTANANLRAANAELRTANDTLRAQVAFLEDENLRLRVENNKLQQQVTQLQEQVRELTGRLAEAQRASKRQAAPFSKGPPCEHPKRPGRKPGEAYGPKAHRPIPEQAPDEIHDAPLPPCCPDCGGPTVEDRVDHQYQTEIPRRPIYRRFDIHIGHCAHCGQRVQGRHALQTSDALGAAASQLGGDAQAAVVHLNKDAGLSHGKIAVVFETFFGIAVTPSGVCQAMQRAARRCEPTYQALVEAVPQAPWIVPDETGWRIGGRTAWLHAFVIPEATVYVVAVGRGVEVAEGIIGAGYDGGMTHDGYAAYDRFYMAHHQQCLDHLLRRCDRLEAAAVGGAVVFPRQVRGVLVDALELRDRRDAGAITPHGLSVARGRLEKRLDRLLHWTRRNPDNERLAKHLARHRGQIFTFLKRPGLDATNYRAEQAIRPAAVNRKVWGGNRTQAGAKAQSVLLTVLRTCAQRAVDAFRFIGDLLRGGKKPGPPVLPSGP
jgi:transposase